MDKHDSKNYDSIYAEKKQKEDKLKSYWICEECNMPIKRYGHILRCENGCYEDNIQNFNSEDDRENGISIDLPEDENDLECNSEIANFDISEDESRENGLANDDIEEISEKDEFFAYQKKRRVNDN